MNKLAKIIPLALALSAITGSDAFAGQYLSSASRTSAYQSSSTSDVSLPLTNDNAVTSLSFTVAKDGRVKITYNAECEVTAPRGRWLNIRVLVDGIGADPA